MVGLYAMEAQDRSNQNMEQATHFGWQATSQVKVLKLTVYKIWVT